MNVFVEVSPHPALTVAIEDVAAEAGVDAVVVGTLQRHGTDFHPLSTAVAALHVNGVQLDWRAVYAEQHARPVRLPVYPFRHTPAEPERPGIRGELTGLPAGEQNRLLLELVRSHTAAVLGIERSGDLDADMTFGDLGIDSVTAVALRNRLNATTGLRLPGSLVYGHPTPAAVAHHLRAKILGLDDDVSLAIPAPAADDEPIAIVAMGCRFPGGVRTPEEFWQLIAEGRDAVSPLPDDRGWDLRPLTDPHPGQAGQFYQREGGFVDATAFDAAFFRIHRAKRWRWIRSSGCCLRSPGRSSSGPGSSPRRFAAARLASSSGR